MFSLETVLSAIENYKEAKAEIHSILHTMEEFPRHPISFVEILYIKELLYETYPPSVDREDGMRWGGVKSLFNVITNVSSFLVGKITYFDADGHPTRDEVFIPHMSMGERLMLAKYGEDNDLPFLCTNSPTNYFPDLTQAINNAVELASSILPVRVYRPFFESEKTLLTALNNADTAKVYSSWLQYRDLLIRNQDKLTKVDASDVVGIVDVILDRMCK